MAYIGLQYIVAAKKGATAYTDAVVLGEAIGMDIDPQYKEGSLYGDNRQVDTRKKFKNAKVTLETTKLPIKASEVMFGHTVSEENGTVTCNTADEPNSVGVCACSTEVNEDSDKYEAILLHSVKFSEGKTSYKTEDDSITYATPSVDGIAIGESSGNWKETKLFDTFAEAKAWVDEKMGITTESPSQA